MTQWLARKTGETKPITLTAYRAATNEFTAFMGKKASQQIQYITKADIAKWRDAAAAKASARTANNKLKVIRTLFQSAWRDGLISENPAAKIHILKTETGNRRPFTMPELRRVYEMANDEWQGMILAGLYTGQRLKDIASLTWANVNLERNEIVLSTSKTARRQFIPIAKPLRKHLLSLPSSDNPTAPLFPKAHGIATSNNNTSALSQQFHGILVSAGFAKERAPKHMATGKGREGKRETNELSFHCLRHTATSLLKIAGISEIVARDLIGHESEAVSRNYSHVDEESKRKAIAVLPDLFG